MLNVMILSYLALFSAGVQGVYQLPADRATVWNPGVTVDGETGHALGSDRLPVRTKVYKTISASTYGKGAKDATAGINAALAACPAGQVVDLSSGTFLVNSGIVSIAKSDIVLRGAGAGVTKLVRTNGAKMGSYQPGAAMPNVIITDVAKGATQVTVGNASGFATGQKVLVDEQTMGVWSALPARNGTPTIAWSGSSTNLPRARTIRLRLWSTEC
jgi:hypothetical protein